MQYPDNKKIICTEAGRVLKELKKEKSLYMISLEYGISTSLLNSLERGLKDPQLTTVFKLAEALNIRASEFVRLIESHLDKDFTMIDK